MKLIATLVFVLLTSSFLLGQDPLILQEFKDPGREYSIVPLWSWNGTLKPGEVKRQIDLMIEQGVYGAFMHARAGINSGETPYFSDGWWEAMDSTMAYAARTRFEAWIYDEDKWPSGSAGGRTIAKNPEEFIKKGLRYTLVQLKEGDAYPIDLQGKFKIFAVRMTGEKSYDRASKIDLTRYQENRWIAPRGTWTILMFEKSTDRREPPDEHLAQIDYFNKDAVRAFIDITHEAYYQRYGKLFGTTIPGVFFDEIYFHRAGPGDVLPWSNDFAESFKARKGYDIVSELPSLVLQSTNSPSVNYDYFDELTHRYDEAWFKQIADWCDTHGGIGLTGHTEETFHSYKAEGDYFRTIGSKQFPGTDNEDFRYNFPRYIHWYKPKKLSSASHIYGRKRSAVEAMGGGGYMITPEEYRYGMAKLGVCGINFFIPHLFHYTVDNIKAYRDWPPSWFFRNPYWKYFKPLADYGRRISYMNRQGAHVCHVAVLFPLTEQWAGGYSGDVDDRDYNEVQETLLNNQVDYDVMNDDAFLKSDCSSGKIQLHDESYRVLILSSLNMITLETAKKIAEFYDNGGTVIATNKFPFSSIDGDDAAVQALMYHVFGIKPRLAGKYYDVEPGTFTTSVSNTNPENGNAYYTKSIRHLVPVVKKCIPNELEIVEGKHSALRFHQRRSEDVTYYLLMNEERQNNSYRIVVPDYGIPFKLDPETGAYESVDNYLSLDGSLQISLHFKPWEAFFLVFLPGTKEEKRWMIASTSLEDGKLHISGREINLSGWIPPGISPYAQIRFSNGMQLESRHEDHSSLTPWAMEGNWRFQIAKNRLDQQWTDQIKEDTIEIPVMKFYANLDDREWNFSSPDFEDQHLPEIKMADRFSDQKGAVRYLSPWNASRIIFYDRWNHLSAMGGQNAKFRKTFNLNRIPGEAIVKVAAEPSYTLFVNGNNVGSGTGPGDVGIFDIAPYLKAGTNEIGISVPRQRGLILEGSIETDDDFLILNTDDSWDASIDDLWEPALIHSKPSLGTWKDVDFTMDKIQFPVTCWYRQQLPAGAAELILPERRGVFEYFVNGEPVKERGGRLKLPENSGNALATLAVKAIIQSAEEGLLAPVRVICRETEVPLVPWKDLGLSWYTGRAIYTKEFTLPSGFDGENVKTVLDPGDVKWFSEIWVNGQLVTFNPWGSKKTDITPYLQKRSNTIAIVVSNLKANEAFWDVPDVLVEESYNRWWQQGATLREEERLESGLTGPVRLIPMQYIEWKDEVEF